MSDGPTPDAILPDTPAAEAAPRRIGVVRLSIRVLLFGLLGAAIWLRFTDAGQAQWAAIAQYFRPARDTEIGSRLEELGVRVTYEGRGDLKRITSLDFDGRLPPAALLADLRKLDGLNIVSLSGCKIDDAGIEAIGRIPNVTNIDLSHADLADDHLRSLVPLKQLTALHLLGTPITDAALPSLVEMEEVHVLNVSRTRITDEGLKTLALLPNLELLLVAETEVTDAGLENLAGAAKLKKIVLTRTGTTRAGHTRLQTLIPGVAIVD